MTVKEPDFCFLSVALQNKEGANMSVLHKKEKINGINKTQISA